VIIEGSFEVVEWTVATVIDKLDLTINRNNSWQNFSQIPRHDPTNSTRNVRV
jgi:hypothetical protein